MGFFRAHTSASSACPVCRSTNAQRLFSTTRNDKVWHLARCRDCAQYYTDPLPTLDDISGFYSGEYHANLLSEESTEAEFGAKFRRYADWITRYVRGGRSLDVGCTTGLFPHILKQRGFDAEGLEINTTAAGWGMQHYGLPIRTEAFELADYPARSFRLVSMADVLEHALDPLVTLSRVHTLLEDHGYAFVSFPDIESVESRYMKALAQSTGRDWFWGCCHIPLHTWEFTRATAEKMFQKAGFEVAGFRRSRGPAPEPAPLSVAMLCSPVRLLGIPVVGKKLGTQMEFVLRKRS
jgi:2-polyprenyl-3-methyl-5-hydroxy-6-metoxy-1,4-benzoquinol methylase